MRYKIVLYNAGKRIKCLGTFDKYSEANEFYQLNLVPKNIFFPKISDWRGRQTDFELVLLGPPEGQNIDHIRDEIGRKVALTAPDGYTIKKISEYFVEETFLHKNTGQKLQFKDLVKRFVLGKPGTKLFHSIKNKLVIEYADIDDLDLFTLKNQSDAVRLNNIIRDFCMNAGIETNLYFPNMEKDLRIMVYKMCEDRLGLSRRYMTRESTR